jgi:C4-dicarboxylate-specific signal transduction histidine kinase
MISFSAVVGTFVSDGHTILKVMVFRVEVDKIETVRSSEMLVSTNTHGVII